ncbi:MAG: P1 family peptidase [Armatimonadetes bacterium]|nr:P1 family peptidase [Armatimonadota bacterium]
MKRARIRDLGIVVGTLPPGPLNAITDVEGVRVGHVTKIEGKGKLVPGRGPVRTGVTAILPHSGDIWHEKVPAASFVFNGCGELTGLWWVRESGFLEVPILLTNTHCVGRVGDGVVSYMQQQYSQLGIGDDVVTPVVGECDDSTLNDIRGRHISEADVLAALRSAGGGPVPEGAVGAGTGMICYGFKGGIGTSSRVLPADQGGYMTGVLSLCNQGIKEELTILGVPVGRQLTGRSVTRKSMGSIIIIAATDAPLSPRQLERLAKRAPLGLGRTGTVGHNGSGDFIIAFSTTNRIPHRPEKNTRTVTALSDRSLDSLFQAVEEATEESILNALSQAQTMEGRDGNIAEALPLDQVKTILHH